MILAGIFIMLAILYTAGIGIKMLYRDIINHGYENMVFKLNTLPFVLLFFGILCFIGGI